MSRYLAIAVPQRPNSSDYWDEGPLLEGRTVYEEDGAPVKTGLLDANGTAIYRLSDRIKPGFAK